MYLIIIHSSRDIIVGRINRFEAGQQRKHALIHGRGKRLIPSSKSRYQRQPIYSLGNSECFLEGQAASRVKLTTPSHLVLRRRMLEAIPLLPLYNFMEYRKISLPLLFLSLYVPVVVGDHCPEPRLRLHCSY
jgi:hypothetical protein